MQQHTTFKTLEDIYDEMVREVLFSHGRHLYGVNLDVRGESTRIILKTLTKDKPEICFINASTLERAMEVLVAFNYSTADVGVKWREDKYFRP